MSHVNSSTFDFFEFKKTAKKTSKDKVSSSLYNNFFLELIEEQKNTNPEIPKEKNNPLIKSAIIEKQIGSNSNWLVSENNIISSLIEKLVNHYNPAVLRFSIEGIGNSPIKVNLYNIDAGLVVCKLVFSDKKISRIIQRRKGQILDSLQMKFNKNIKIEVCEE